MLSGNQVISPVPAFKWQSLGGQHAVVGPQEPNNGLRLPTSCLSLCICLASGATGRSLMAQAWAQASAMKWPTIHGSGRQRDTVASSDGPSALCSPHCLPDLLSWLQPKGNCVTLPVLQRGTSFSFHHLGFTHAPRRMQTPDIWPSRMKKQALIERCWPDPYSHTFLILLSLTFRVCCCCCFRLPLFCAPNAQQDTFTVTNSSVSSWLIQKIWTSSPVHQMRLGDSQSHSHWFPRFPAWVFCLAIRL